MSHKEYSAKLEELNIFINSKNFLVYQGKVEEIALKNAKERMHMFEEISESVQFKDDYIKVIPNTISSPIKSLSWDNCVENGLLIELSKKPEF